MDKRQSPMKKILLAFAGVCLTTPTFIDSAQAQDSRPPNERPVEIEQLQRLCGRNEEWSKAGCAYFILGTIQGLNRTTSFSCLDEKKDNQGALKDMVVSEITHADLDKSIRFRPASEFVVGVLLERYPCLAGSRVWKDK
jgi:hypothetical protein